MNTNQAPMHYYKFNEDGEPIRSDFHFSDKEDRRMTFEEWVEAQERDVFLDYSSAKVGWAAGQKAERERIKKIVEQVGVQGNHDQWFDCADTIAERIDSER